MELPTSYDTWKLASPYDGEAEKEPDMSFEDFIAEVFHSYKEFCAHGIKSEIQINSEGQVYISVFPKGQKALHVFAEWSTQSALELKAMDAKLEQIRLTARS